VRARRARRGLSPLIAAVVLISATIVGGMLVYQYFQNSMNKAQALAQGVSISADTIPLTANKSLITVTVVNNYDKPIQVKGANGIDTNGNTTQLTPSAGTSLPVTVEPGGKTTLTFTSQDTIKAVTITYSVDGVTHQSEPARVG
jgi:flagellin-like protein